MLKKLELRLCKVPYRKLSQKEIELEIITSISEIKHLIE